MEWLERTELLFGKENLKKLNEAKILVVGLGGVGAYAAEQLCRAGIGNLTIVDGDIVEESNRNRQLLALKSTTGKSKVEIMAKRLRDINPNIKLTAINKYLEDEATINVLKNDEFDYVVDAIDTISPKVYLIYHARQLGLKIVSSMGAGGKTDPSKIQITDISKSYNCKLGRIVRKRLSRLGIKKGVKVVFSSEMVKDSAVRIEESKHKKSTVGTISYMPPIFGCNVASVVINDLLLK